MIRARPTLCLPPQQLGDAEADAWPAIGPNFSLVGGQPSYAPAEPATVAGARSLAARVGAQGQDKLAKLRAAQALPNWQLTFAEAAANFKLGQPCAAMAKLRAVVADPQLLASLQAPPLNDQAELYAAHWLWLVAHVAVENGHGNQALPALLHLGLAARAAREPRLAANLLVNAMEQGDPALLTLLDAANFKLSHSRVAQLNRHVAGKLDELFGPQKKYVLRHPHKLATLAWLRQAYGLLRLPAEPFARYDAWQAQLGAGAKRKGLNFNPWKKSPTRTLEPDAAAPRRTTGVQLRVEQTGTDSRGPGRLTDADLRELEQFRPA